MADLKSAVDKLQVLDVKKMKTSLETLKSSHQNLIAQIDSNNTNVKSIIDTLTEKVTSLESVLPTLLEKLNE